MEKNYIKMNTGHNYLSLGNLFLLIKNNAKDKNMAMQTEIFCTIINTNDVNTTTINNYCVGYRAISLEYKKLFEDKYELYQKDKNTFLDNIIALINILNNQIYLKNSKIIEEINLNSRFNKLCSSLITLAKEDNNVPENTKDHLLKMYSHKNLYEFFIEILNYVILENKQPIYIQDIAIDINEEELNEYLKINLYEGLNYISSLKILAQKNNMYANAELGSLEFSGLLDGNINYDKSFNYYLKAAKKNHPKACWMIADMILTKKYGNIKKDFNTWWLYLNKAVKLGSVAAINTLGNCYLNGLTLEGIKNEKKALTYYEKAANKGYKFAYNNLGLYYERKKDNKEALKYFLISVDLNESWALNKVGEIYRKTGNLDKAFFYYNEAIKCPLNEINYYAYYNLANYFYLPGNKNLNIKKNKSIAKKYLQLASKKGIKKATKLLETIK